MLSSHPTCTDICCQLHTIFCHLLVVSILQNWWTNSALECGHTFQKEACRVVTTISHIHIQNILRKLSTQSSGAHIEQINGRTRPLIGYHIWYNWHLVGLIGFSTIPGCYRKQFVSHRIFQAPACGSFNTTRQWISGPICECIELNPIQKYQYHVSWSHKTASVWKY